MAEFDPQATAAQNQDPGMSFNLRNLMALGRVLGTGALALAGGAIASAMDTDPASASGSYPSYQCNNVLAPGFDTIICNLGSPKPRGEVEQDCTTIIFDGGVVKNETLVGGSLPRLKASYLHGSTSNFGFSVELGQVQGCAPAGKVRESIHAELRQGPDGQWAQDSKTKTVTTDNGEDFKGTLSAPYNCAVDPAGSAVRAVQAYGWVPRPGWHGHKTTAIGDGKPITVC